MPTALRLSIEDIVRFLPGAGVRSDENTVRRRETKSGQTEAACRRATDFIWKDGAMADQLADDIISKIKAHADPGAGDIGP
ncbi:MAG: hypothetical protein M3Y43_07545, partial [Pseudomonadota bacterium]|nr:hypothetical protein [Pseudomonadota bacterium]